MCLSYKFIIDVSLNISVTAIIKHIARMKKISVISLYTVCHIWVYFEQFIIKLKFLI